VAQAAAATTNQSGIEWSFIAGAPVNHHLDCGHAIARVLSRVPYGPIQTDFSFPVEHLLAEIGRLVLPGAAFIFSLCSSHVHLHVPPLSRNASSVVSFPLCTAAAMTPDGHALGLGRRIEMWFR
jgi:hypothetical protein